MHIVTSYNIINRNIMDININLIDDEKLIKEIKKHFWNKNEKISQMVFNNNLEKSFVSKIHNLMEKEDSENIEIPPNIKNNKKYLEKIFDNKIKYKDIEEYIKENIPENEIVLLCNGNFLIKDSESWENITIANNEVYCMSSLYKHIDHENEDGFLFSNPETNFYKFHFEKIHGTKDTEDCENKKKSIYLALNHFAYIFKQPVLELWENDFEYFNVSDANKMMNLLLKDSGYERKNPAGFESNILFDNEKTNYQGSINENNIFMKEARMNTNDFSVFYGI
jgi:hypothetical protein